VQGVLQVKSELKYQKLAKERKRAALRGRSLVQEQARLAAAADRLFRWRKVDRKYAARAVGWENCK
jgi:SOS response regulatory protein OraA/RecX